MVHFKHSILIKDTEIKQTLAKFKPQMKLIFHFILICVFAFELRFVVGDLPKSSVSALNSIRAMDSTILPLTCCSVSLYCGPNNRNVRSLFD